MSRFFRTNQWCSELDRTPDEIIAFANLPTAERPRRLRTHSETCTSQYVQECARFARFNEARGRPTFVRQPNRAADLILDFIKEEHENKGRGVCAVLAAVTAIRTWYFTRDYERPDSRKLGMYLLALRKEHKPVRATPVDGAKVKAMVRHAIASKSSLVGARDVAMITGAYTSAERPIEWRTLRYEDIFFDPEERGMRLRIPESKGDQQGEGQWVTITPAFDQMYCPIRSLKHWLAEANIASGHVFRTIDRHGNIGPDKPMSHEAYRQFIRYYLTAIDLPGRRSGYSMRRGYATTAHDNGASEEEIQRQLRHKDPRTTRIYIDDRPIPFERSITGVLLA
jgi:integrase